MSELAYPDIKTRPDPTDVLLDFVLAQRERLRAAGVLPAAGQPGDLLDRNVGTETPSTGLVGRLPFVLAGSFGSDTDRFGGDYDVEVSVFSDRYSKAKSLALGLEALVLGYPWRVNSGGRSVLVDRVAVTVPFAEVEWQKDSDIRRFQGSIQISIRR